MPGEAFEDAIKEAKQERDVKDDTDLDTDDLKALTQKFKDAYKEHTDEDFPQDPQEQLKLAIRAVFDSWTGERAVSYRRLNRIPDDWGTAVNVQQMVFGNKGDNSATGVAFSRDEVTGEKEPSGDFLVNAQGEDVVSGVRNTRDIAELKDVMPEAHGQLMEILSELEQHYKDMQDTEFTIEDGQLFMLQTRNAKRPAQAAVRFAVDAVDEGLLSKEEALSTIDPSSLDALLHPTFDPKAEFEVLASGVSASPGAAKGEIVFTAKEAVQAEQDGRDVILVRPFTEADDVAGFHAAKGILTSEGGKASHAALVARGMGRPAVVGASELKIDLGAKTVSANGSTVGEGDFIAIDGTKGCVTLEDVPLIDARVDEYFDTVLEWADELRRLKVRANADDPAGAKKARDLGGARELWRGPARRDHDPADRLRARAGDPARAGGADRGRAGPVGGRGLHGRHDDRAAAGLLRGQPDRRARRLLLVRHQRPHADGAGVLARRRRVEVRARLHGAQDHRPLAVRDDRQAGRRLARAARLLGGPRGEARAQARHLR
jgi:pyruvate,orthophosphate dikinase